jgi:deleted-in-malignant-brain-tumors protein 1
LVCTNAGFSFYGAKISRGIWKDGDHLFTLYNVQCFGNESNILECQYDTTGYCSRYYSSEVSVICQQKRANEMPANCTNGDIRLHGSSKHNEGTLQVCSNGIWGVVCSSYYWNNQDTNVACHELGFTRYGNSYSNTLTHKQYPSFTRFHCNGNEERLSSCSSSVSTQECFYASVYIKCQLPCTTGDIRLAGGSYYGRIEVCIGGVWSTICRDIYWDNNDASVACKQLGFSPYGAIAIPVNWYSEYSNPTLIKGLNCTGLEDSVFECPNIQNTPSCSSSADANVICQIHNLEYSNCTDGEVRLFGGSTDYEGTIEVCLNHAWGTISRYWTWNYNEAQTVCNSLGYTTPGASLVYNAHFGEGTGPILMNYVQCSTPRSSLLDCSIRYHYSIDSLNHNQDVGVICQPPCNSGDIRLEGANDPLLGRVEVCVNGTWGTICDDYWDNNDASVVCRQLGLSSNGAYAGTGLYTEYGRHFHIIDLNCNGTENNILNCSYNNITQHSCYHYEDAYVRCQRPTNFTVDCKHGVIRLLDGETENEGRVEICVDGNWQSICPNYWYDNNAKVACRQLGYPPIGTVINTFGKGVGLLNSLRYSCNGNEPNLTSCRNYTISCSNSNSHHAGGVRCEMPCSETTIRIKGSYTEYNNFGRVEVCVNGTWGTICDDYWDNNDARQYSISYIQHIL